MTRDEHNQRARRRWRIILPVLIWIVMFAWSHVPPFRGNVLEHKRDFLVWHWKLYSRAGETICDVRYFDMKQGGAPIERWTLYGYDRPGKMPENIARTYHKQLLDEYQRVCHAMREQGDSSPEIEVQARCADHGQWKTVERRKRNVCTIKRETKTKTKTKTKAKTKAKQGEPGK